MPLKRRDLLAHRDLTTLVASAVFAGAGVLFRRFTVDDAFIAYRHAANLAAGAGPVMNAGERVEGVSNLPWTALLGLAAFAGLEPHAVAPVLAFLCGLAGVVLTAELAARATGDARAGGLASLWLACSAPWAIWSASGMETTLYAVVLLLVLVGVASRDAAGAGTGLGLGFLAVLRPEGILFAFPVLGAHLRAGPGWGTRVARAALGLAAVVVPVTIFRRLYYGDWLPNPVYVKAGLGTAAARAGALYVAKLVLVHAPVFLFLLLALVAARRRRAVACIAACIASQLAFAIALGGDHFDGYRFVVPVLPLLAAGAEAGCRDLRRRPAPRRALGAGAVTSATLGLLLLFGAGQAPRFASPLLELGRVHRGIETHAARLISEARLAGWILLGLGALAAWIAARGRDLAAVEIVSKPERAQAGLAEVVHETSRARRALAVVVAAALALTVLPAALDPSLRSCREADAASRYGRSVGTWLRRSVPAGTLVATNAAGALPYFSELPVVDMLGLTDRHIARRRRDTSQWVGHEKGDGAYVLGRRPGILVFGGPEGSVEPWPFPGDIEIAAHPDFERLYELRRVPLDGFDFVYYSRIVP